MRKPRLLDTRNLSTESMEPTLDSGRDTNIDSSAQKLPFGHMGRHPDYAFQGERDKPIGEEIWGHIAYATGNTYSRYFLRTHPRTSVC